MKRTRRNHPIRTLIMIIAASATLFVLLGYVRNQEASATMANGGPASDSFSPAISPSKPNRANQIRVNDTYGKPPLSFEANNGQADTQIKFKSRGKRYSFLLTPTLAIFSLQKGKSTIDSLDPTHSPATDHHSPPGPAAVMRMLFVGANHKSEVTSLEELPGKLNYLYLEILFKSLIKKRGGLASPRGARLTLR